MFKLLLGSTWALRAHVDPKSDSSSRHRVTDVPGVHDAIMKSNATETSTGGRALRRGLRATNSEHTARVLSLSLSLSLSFKINRRKRPGPVSLS